MGKNLKTATTRHHLFTPGKLPTPLCLMFHPLNPPSPFLIAIHVQQERLHPLFSLFNSQSTSTNVPSGITIRQETFPSA